MYKFYIAMLAGLLSSTAYADTSSINGTSGMGVLENNWVKAGVNKNTGTFGSGGGTSPGLLFDPTGTGTFNAGFDYLTPGSPFDGFALKVDGTNAVNNNTGMASFVDPDGLTDGNGTLTWSGDYAFGASVWNVTNVFALGAASPFVDVTTTITAGSAASSVWFGKYIDPDSQGVPGDSSATDNVLGYGSIPNNHVAFSEATVSRYALGLYSTNSNVDAGISNWTQQADGYTASIYGADYGNGDDTIGLSWNWTGVSVGDILTLNYAYIFGPSAFDAAYDAVAGGAGGGVDVTGGAGVTDVGSATDAASGGGTPTVVSSTTATITSTTEAPSSTLPVLTSSVTHHTSSVSNDVQTIDRETTTTVTTPIDVTTTSFVRTTDTYSDSSVVITDGPVTSTVVLRNDIAVTVTDPGSFVGRVDQVKLLSNDLQKLKFRTGYTGIQGDTRYIGFSKAFDNGIVASLGIAIQDTASENSLTGASKKGVSIKKDDIQLSLAKVDATYAYRRTIGTFINRGITNESGYELAVTYQSDKDGVTPVAGVMIGRTTVDQWSELGSIQSALTFDSFDQSYTVATIGAAYHKKDLGISGSYSTDKQISIAVSAKGFELGAINDLDTHNTNVALGYNLKF